MRHKYASWGWAYSYNILKNRMILSLNILINNILIKKECIPPVYCHRCTAHTLYRVGIQDPEYWYQLNITHSHLMCLFLRLCVCVVSCYLILRDCCTGGLVLVFLRPLKRAILYAFMLLPISGRSNNVLIPQKLKTENKSRPPTLILCSKVSCTFVSCW